jgi:peptidoglycan/xylan/chitin deacetylase (PgdA/CDA1 family)
MPAGCNKYDLFMSDWLTSSQREYVYFHLRQWISFPNELLSKFVFLKTNQPVENASSKVIYRCSDSSLDVNEIREIDNVPILFPACEADTPFYFDQSGNLVFNHDLLKSIFYLLSGYQEYANKSSSDRLGRFNFQDSIQCKLDITHKPVVSYYFQWLADGLIEYGKRNGLPIKAKKLFDNFGFLLSHDIDSVDLYTFEYVAYKVKEILGLVKSPLSRSKNSQLFLSGLLKWIGLMKNDNPHWNFERLRQLERKYQFASTFYFLGEGIRHHDAYYSFQEQRLIALFKFLEAEGCEIGLHGTTQSGRDKEIMRTELEKLKRASGAEITGIRQHRLLWSHPPTAKIQSHVGFVYDTTLGFAAHEGFRNSYCYPFKLYDFENDKTIDIWEFPLVVMDVTLFAYQKYLPDKALEKCQELLSEVKKFNGLFTLLWHNSFFDEDTYPGVTQFYADLLALISEMKPESLLASDLAKRLNELQK